MLHYFQSFSQRCRFLSAERTQVVFIRFFLRRLGYTSFCVKSLMLYVPCIMVKMWYCTANRMILPTTNFRAQNTLPNRADVFAFVTCYFLRCAGNSSTKIPCLFLMHNAVVYCSFNCVYTVSSMKHTIFWIYIR